MRRWEHVASVLGCAVLMAVGSTGCDAQAAPGWYEADVAPTGPFGRYVRMTWVGEPVNALVMAGGVDDTAARPEIADERHGGLWYLDTAESPRRWRPLPGFADAAVRESLHAVALAWDAHREVLVVYGGNGHDGSPDAKFFGDHYEASFGPGGITDVSWVKAEPFAFGDPEMPDRPTDRAHAQLVHDPVRRETLLYGGTHQHPTAPDAREASDWTWILDRNGDWNRRTFAPGEQPPPLRGYGAAWDSWNDRILLFGGAEKYCADTEWCFHNDLWSWDGTGWERLETTGCRKNAVPAPREEAAVWFDPDAGKLMVAGGVAAWPSGGEPLRAAADAWEWNGECWRMTAAPDHPSAQALFAPLEPWGAGGAYHATEGLGLVYAGGWEPETRQLAPRRPERGATHYGYGCGSASGEAGAAWALLLLLALAAGRRWLAATAVLVFAAAAPFGADAKEKDEPRIAYIGITRAQGVTPEEVETLSSFVATELRSVGEVGVIAPSDIEALLGLEQQKQLLGCSTDSACLAEIGGALGASHALYGGVSKLGNRVLFTLTLLDVGDARVVAEVSRQQKARDSLAPLVDALPKMVREAVAPLETGGAAAPDSTPGGTDSAAGARRPRRFVSWKGTVFALRGDVDVLNVGAAPVVELGWRSELLGVHLGVIGAWPLGFRLEGRLTPGRGWPARPYLGAGASFFHDVDLALRGSVGVEYLLGRLRLFLDAAFEWLLLTGQSFEREMVLVSAGVGWRF